MTVGETMGRRAKKTAQPALFQEIKSPKEAFRDIRNYLAGQFVGPRAVTDLLVAAVAPKLGETVVDPACGAGGFLSSVVRYHEANGVSQKQLVKQVAPSLYGIDKDEYLAKLAKLHVALLTG